MKKHFSIMEQFALIVGCFCHDLDHRGTNNAFQSKYVSQSNIFSDYDQSCWINFLAKRLWSFAISCLLQCWWGMKEGTSILSVPLAFRFCSDEPMKRKYTLTVTFFPLTLNLLSCFSVQINFEKCKKMNSLH